MTESDKEQSLIKFSTLQPIVDKLAIYEILLLKWQSRINLIGNATLAHMWHRHFADSAQLARYGQIDKTWADLGSGAGLPGIVLAMLQTSSKNGLVHLIESDQRKAAFLREVSRETGLKTHVHCARAEDVLTDLNVDYVTSRAMADLKTLTNITRNTVEKGGICLFPKGRQYQTELTDAAIDSRFAVEIFPSETDLDGVILRIGRSNI